MVKKKTSAGTRPKEIVPVPNRKELKDAAKELRKGHPSGGRVMAQGAVAKKSAQKTPKRK